MKLYFGLEFDELIQPEIKAPAKGVVRCGRKTLLKTLEAHLGLAGSHDGYEYLRVEQYRQLLLQYQELHPDVFFAKSLEADQFATASELLRRRDELLMAGWDFNPSGHLPPRLQVFAELETMARNAPLSGFTLSTGFADRFAMVMERLDDRIHPFREIWLNEPFELLPVHYQRLLKKLSHTCQRPPIGQLWNPGEETGRKTDLQVFKSLLFAEGKQEKAEARADGSLVVIKSKRATEAAMFVARLLKMNPGFRPTLLIPEKNRLLETALVQEGLPSLGMLSKSLARPTLQLLKLATAFLWEPVDPFKMLEFVTMPLNPLHDQLANALAQELSRKPGINSESWHRAVGQFFSAFENEQPEMAKKARSVYRFWFERQRYDQSKMAPKDDAIEIYRELHRWALSAFEEEGDRYPTLQLLSHQSKRIVELLEALPEQWLTPLDLERIVRTMSEPAPVMFLPRQAGHVPYVNHAGAIAGKLENVLWWNFIETETPHFFSRWYTDEKQWLKTAGVVTDEPSKENDLRLWQQMRPVIGAEKQLILVIPESINGSEAQAHALFADLQAGFKNIGKLIVDLDNWQNVDLLSNSFSVPEKVAFDAEPLPPPRPFLRFANSGDILREQESFTSLEALFYRPYIWFFRYKLGWRPSPIQSVIPEYTLKGNIAHRIFERLLKEDIYGLTKEETDQWVEEEYRRLLNREGATMLMYGKEPDRVAFGNQLKAAAWSLINAIKADGWKVLETEMELEGRFPPKEAEQAVALRGIADLVLEKAEERAIVDIKLSGSGRRIEMLKNDDDLQLVLYAHLLSQNSGYWPQTAYFIVDKGQLIARTKDAFGQANAVKPDSEHADTYQAIMEKMEKTWLWRLNQLRQGLIEIRCTDTAPLIEEHYSQEGVNMMELLEPGEADAKFDDYRALIGLVR